MSTNSLRIATRRSPLAMWQAEHVRDLLQNAHPGLNVELVPIVTEGDRNLGGRLQQIGGKGVFVKELQTAMLANDADLAVHSMKDVPADFPPGLHLAAILQRANPLDALVSNKFKCLDELPDGAVIGTVSLRRSAQLNHMNSSWQTTLLRGNVNTRLAKLDAGEFDAIMLACAGLERLQMHERIAQELSPEVMLPAAGQGAIGIECRIDDPVVNKYVAALAHQPTMQCVTAERAITAALGGNCRVPLAAHAQLHAEHIRIKAIVNNPETNQRIAASAVGPVPDGLRLAQQVADDLLTQGAAEILQQYQL